MFIISSSNQANTYELISPCNCLGLPVSDKKMIFIDHKFIPFTKLNYTFLDIINFSFFLND